MRTMSYTEQKSAKGGIYWKCQHSFHSGWKNNIFVSSKHLVSSTAEARRSEHIRSYAHATHNNTWISSFK